MSTIPAMIRARELERARQDQPTSASTACVMVDSSERARAAVELLRHPDDRVFYDYLAAMPEANRRDLFATVDPAGIPITVGAALENRISKLAILAHFGASLSACDARGNTPLYAALAQGAFVALHGIAKNPKLLAASTDPVVVNAERVAQVFAQAFTEPVADHKKDARLDDVVRKLFGRDLRLDIGEDLMRYTGHVNAWRSADQLRSVEGWHPRELLPHRVRSLVGMYANADETVRPILANEIATTIEAARINQRFAMIEGAHGYSERLARHECTAIAKRVEALSSEADDSTGLRQYVVPIGVPAPRPNAMGHAAYVSFERRSVDGQGVVTFRLDNLGDGQEHHERTGKNLVYPRVFDIPATPEGFAVIEQLLFDLMSIKTDGKIHEIYDALSLAVARALTDTGVMIAVDPKREHVASLSQAAGNCVYENFHASCMHRLGAKLADAIRIFESADVQRRALAAFSPAAMMRSHASNESAIMERSAD